MSNKVDFIVFVGRMQPLHNGHLQILKAANELANKGVIILLGSSFQPRTVKNPYTWEERADMLTGTLLSIGVKNFSIAPIHDYMYNNEKWIKQVQDKVENLVESYGWTDKPPSVGIIGHEKDHSSRYLNWFPQWQFINETPTEDNYNIHATDIRDMYFGNLNLQYLYGVLPDQAFDKMRNFINTPEYTQLVKEYSYYQKYKKDWSVSPYPVTFVTSDAVVVQDGHVLLVQRKHEPGKGLWALPGGFLNPTERTLDGAVRELVEETKIKVPEPVLYGSLDSDKPYHVFDHPERSLRGRTITHAYYFKLKSVGALPKVKGSDDALVAKWFSLSEVSKMEDQLFEDHIHIINYFVGT